MSTYLKSYFSSGIIVDNLCGKPVNAILKIARRISCLHKGTTYRSLFRSQMSKSRQFRVELQCKEKFEFNVPFLQEGCYHLVFRERDENDITVSFQD